MTARLEWHPRFWFLGARWKRVPGGALYIDVFLLPTVMLAIRVGERVEGWYG